MGCEEIKERLSEYVDDLLDEESKVKVEEHLLTCHGCRQELSSLKALVHELGSLKPVEPPRDFLEQIHERLEQPSRLSKILRFLFVPKGIKIPFQVAGALAAAVLVASLFYVQQGEMKTAKAPESLPQPSLAEMESPRADKARGKGAAMLAEQAPERPAAGMTKKEAAPVELALMLKTEPSRRSFAPEPAVDALGGVRKEKRQTMAAAKALEEEEKGAPEKEDKRPLNKLIDLITSAQGKVRLIEYDKDTQAPSSIRAEIPAQAFAVFYEKLRDLGDVSPPPEAPADESQKDIELRIRILPGG